MKGNSSPLKLILIGGAALLGLGVLVWRLAGSGGSTSGVAAPVIVRPDNPDDPKYRPDPKLGLVGGGG